MTTQAERFRGGNAGGGGLPSEPTFDLIVFEAINFMDAQRSTAEIADLLAFEYGAEIDRAWVDRLVAILSAQKIVAPGR